jgi:hypothetical protein
MAALHSETQELCSLYIHWTIWTNDKHSKTWELCSLNVLKFVRTDEVVPKRKSISSERNYVVAALGFSNFSLDFYKTLVSF